ncbi:MAG TPA: hypothetical protein VFJ21_05720 [Mycobacteriales bacterium]|nr:hypothetical protein [Mycobacteriales bacterium]
MTLLLYVLAGFLLGGAISVWRNQPSTVGRALAVVLGVIAAIAASGGVLNS